MFVHADAKSQASAVSQLAVLVDEDWSTGDTNDDARSLEFISVVKAAAHEERPIKIRVARLLAWAKAQDVQVAGYPGWTAFVAEYSPWRASRTRDFVRLAESELDVIKEAVANNELEFTVATRAPQKLGRAASREAQIQWIGEAKIGRWSERHRAFSDVLTGDEMRRVLDARRLAEILVGSDAPMSVIDDFILECHAQNLTRDQVLERARAAPRRPERLGNSVPDWKDTSADALLGLWVEPTDMNQAVAMLRTMTALLDQRRLLLGMAYCLIREHQLWKSVPGCGSLEELCQVHLGIGQRAFQRYAHEGLQYLQNPGVRKEVEEGRLTLDRATFAIDRSGGSKLSLQSWLELVQRLNRAELRDVEERGGDPRKEYGPALAMAQAVEAILQGGKAEASAIGGTAARIAEHLRAVGATGHVQVALRHDSHRPAREPESIFASRELLAAADYLLKTVVLPPVYGPRRMIERDGYACQNPRCRRRTLRVHPHHIHEQQHGGTDDPPNLVTLCPACHLRGIHSRQMSVVRFDDWLVWNWPAGGVVIMDSPVSALDYDRRRAAMRTNAASHTRPGAPGVAHPQPRP